MVKKGQNMSYQENSHCIYGDTAVRSVTVTQGFIFSHIHVV